jgi:NAD(P)-dependent dehydrogenase (short-subunit alcohol dehydrogenase family)
MSRTPKVVVVTGATAGLGRATARAFGERGDAVGLLARGRDALDAARADVERAGGRALALPTDVADAQAVEAAAARVEEELGPIDVWVNNAMTTVFAPLHEISADEYRRATEVTYLGAVWGTMAALRRMRPRDSGHIVQVGSALAYRGIPLQAPYCAAKHAIQGLVDSLRCELLHDGSRVRLTMVQMPALNTPQFDWCLSRLPRRAQPVPPIFQPEVGAEAIVWASEHDRREIYVGTPTLLAIVGNKLAPWLGDRYLARTGYAAQQTPEPEQPDRPVNLWEPVAGDRGAHGRFDGVAHPASRELWTTLHRGTLVAAAGAAGAAALAAIRR